MSGLRDELIIADVANMADLKRFDEEISVYGTSYWSPDIDTINYVVSCKRESIEEFIEKYTYNNTYFTPITVQSCRCLIPSGARAAVIKDSQSEMLKKMKHQYEPEYYAIMPKYYMSEATNEAKQDLKTFQKLIDGRFEYQEIFLFFQTVKLAYEMKVLTKDGFQEFEYDCFNLFRQMENDPCVKDVVNREFFGFAYLVNGIIRYSINAQKRVVQEERFRLILNGFLTAPIVSKQYALKDFSQIVEAKNDFQNVLSVIEDESYMRFLERLRNLQRSFSKEPLMKAYELLKNKEWAGDAIKYYMNIWNVNKLED